MFQESRFSKMEKADILEMTVKHLKNVQKHQQTTTTPTPATAVTAANRYRAGFSECAREVRRYLSSVDGLGPEVHERLMGHLETVARRAGSGTGMYSGKQCVTSATTSSITAIATEPVAVPAAVVPTSTLPTSSAPTGAPQTRKIPILPMRTCTVNNVSNTNGPVSLSTSGNVPVLPLISGHHDSSTIVNSNATLPVQTLTISGSTTRVLLASQPVAMPTTVTLITREQSMESRITSELSSGTAIPLYINTEQFNVGVGASQSSPGASDGESAGSVSPFSTVSNSSNNSCNASSSSHHWIMQQPNEHPLQAMKQHQPQSQLLGPVWRPW